MIQRVYPSFSQSDIQRLAIVSKLHQPSPSSSSLSSTTLCEFWLAQLFLSVASSPVSFVSNWSLHLPQVILTSSSHLTLGLPFSLVAYGFHLYMVLATLSLVILSTFPNQPSCFYFIYLTIFSLLIASSISLFVLSLHSPFAFCVEPNILLNIFLSNTNNFCLMFVILIHLVKFLLYIACITGVQFFTMVSLFLSKLRREGCVRLTRVLINLLAPELFFF